MSLLDAPRDGPFPWREKSFALLVHLVLSGLALGGLLAVTLLVWYPDFLYATDGGWVGLRIVVLVDLVLGPALTFVVFRRGKPGLALDLSLIAALQVVALVAGAWVLFDERPLAIVFSGDRFYTVTHDDFDAIDVPRPDFSAYPGARPWHAAAVLPTDPDAQNRILGPLMRVRQPVYTHAPLYRPLAEALDAIRAADVGAARLAALDDDAFRAWRAAHPSPTEPLYVRFSTRYMLTYLAVDPATGALIDQVPIDAPLGGGTRSVTFGADTGAGATTGRGDAEDTGARRAPAAEAGTETGAGSGPLNGPSERDAGDTER